MMNKFFVAIAFISMTISCDFFRQEKCEWYLVPEPKDKHLVEKGWVSLCARNYVTNKQKCYFAAELSYAEAIFGKPFRLSSLVYDEDSFPRKVKTFTPCSERSLEKK